MIALDIIDANSQVIEAVLDEELFYISLDWNSSNMNWVLGIRNSAYEMVISGISGVPNYPLTKQFRYSTMPAGELFIAFPKYRNSPVPRDGFQKGYELIYVTQAEVCEYDPNWCIDYVTYHPIQRQPPPWTPWDNNQSFWDNDESRWDGM